MKVLVDPTLCQGHGLCYMNAPQLFAADDEGHAVAPDGEVPATDHAAARDAVGFCPERAISVVE